MNPTKFNKALSRSSTRNSIVHPHVHNFSSCYCRNFLDFNIQMLSTIFKSNGVLLEVQVMLIYISLPFENCTQYLPFPDISLKLLSFFVLYSVQAYGSLLEVFLIYLRCEVEYALSSCSLTS